VNTNIQELIMISLLTFYKNRKTKNVFKQPQNKYQYLKWSTVFVGTLLLAACGGDDNDNPVKNDTKPTIFEIASNDERFDSLELALVTTGLDSALDDSSATYTVFAPTDDAFDKLGDTLTELLGDTDTLSDILQYHVINGAAVNKETAVSLSGNTQAMLNGDKIAIRLEGEDLFINYAKVILTDIEASNGIIHAIDTVLIPPTSSESGLNIVDTAVVNGSFSTLITALEAAGLKDLLEDESKTFTVFAPTDDAFMKIDTTVLEELLADTTALTDTLLYHVIEENTVDSMTALSLAGQTVSMANGGKTNLSTSDGALFVNSSKVTITNIKTTNGIIHVIDTVLIPE